ncbi:hypothetical protein ACFYO7_29915 [Nocardia salmonicida]|uniref:hypothetical protein n=1 Tax=Nocardia salmonicida TaxID=53431 RepID=UPI0036C142F6
MTDAAHHLRHGATEAAVDRLEHATTYVRGFPAAMIHASTIPVEYYMAAVRPSMQPPEVSIPLSGRQHRGYKTFHSAMKDLLTVVPDSYDELSARDPEPAAARGALLEADLVDSGRHVTLAYSMVRLRRSIAQLPTGPDNAVGELRLMRHRRAAQYTPLIRFGDHCACAVTTNGSPVCEPPVFAERCAPPSHLATTARTAGCRTFALADLRRSRDHRPDDGYVLTR